MRFTMWSPLTKKLKNRPSIHIYTCKGGKWPPWRIGNCVGITKTMNQTENRTNLLVNERRIVYRQTPQCNHDHLLLLVWNIKTKQKSSISIEDWCKIVLIVSVLNLEPIEGFQKEVVRTMRIEAISKFVGDHKQHNLLRVVIRKKKLGFKCKHGNVCAHIHW